MVKKIGSSGRRKTRHLFSKDKLMRGKTSISRSIAKFDVGEKVVLSIEPSVQKGLFHMRFFGKIGKVVGSRGRAYIVEIKDGGVVKQIITLPIHLRKYKSD